MLNRKFLVVRWRSFFKVPVNGREPGLRASENLQIMLISRFCKFPKSKTVNYHMQVFEGASRTRQDKIGR